MINIKFSNKAVYTVIGILVLLTATLVVYAISGKPNPGHWANSISIGVDGDTKKLGDAFRQLENEVDNIGGYEHPECVHCSWNGWRCVDQEDGPYDWYGHCKNGCIIEVKTGQYC